MFKNKNGKVSILKILGTVILFLLLVGGVLAFKINRDIQALKNRVVVEDISVESKREVKVEVEEGEPLNILLLGTDGNDIERTEDNGFVSRSDTIMIVSLNPQNRTTKMLSIPRDTLATIKGYDGYDKINHAFAYGGIELAIDTIQNFLNIPIDYYAVLDMSGLEELIDAVGGIEVTSPLTFTYRGTGFVKGETRTVNGVKAMNFARMRYDDPEGEVGRQNRQKLVIKAILDKLLSLNAVSYYPAILEVVANNVRTNFDLTTILSIYPKYVAALSNISALQFDTLQDLYLDGVFYFNIPVSSRAKISNELRAHTNLPIIQLSSLIDPLESDTKEFTKAKAIVINQYPSGLSQAQLEAINNAQQQVQLIREVEYYYVEPESYDVPIVPQTTQAEVIEPETSIPSTPEVPIAPFPEVTQTSSDTPQPPVPVIPDASEGAEVSEASVEE